MKEPFARTTFKRSSGVGVGYEQLNGLHCSPSIECKCCRVKAQLSFEGRPWQAKVMVSVRPPGLIVRYVCASWYEGWKESALLEGVTPKPAATETFEQGLVSVTKLLSPL